MATGIDMLIASVCKALKIDREAVLREISGAVEICKKADARLTAIEAQLSRIESMIGDVHSNISVGHSINEKVTQLVLANRELDVREIGEGSLGEFADSEDPIADMVAAQQKNEAFPGTIKNAKTINDIVKF